MTFEFRCDSCGLVTEEFCKSVAWGGTTPAINCECGGVAKQIVSVPLAFLLYGNPDGWTNPSKAKRHSYKTFDRKTGNA